MIDLHVHSNKSDGTFSPTQLVEYAVKKGLTAFALTDHDTADGLEEAIAASKSRPVTVIPGIEFSTSYEDKDIHVLGLAIHYKAPVFLSALADFVASREQRNERMCQKLRDYAKIDITYEKLKQASPGAVITRAHYAGYLLEHGVVNSMPEAFERFIGDQAPCFIPREKVTPLQAVRLIREAEGIPVLAHPPLYHLSDARLEALVKMLTENGLAGVEALYSTYTPGEETHMKSLARKYGLLITGGSDFHGARKPDIDMGTGKGNLYVHDSILDALYAYQAR
ncbi:MAG: PHP domain-containing protein [Lachnospiraceae bacterium]|jgi:hypothetical protein|nr:PHP domain-containing protein [Lachnospiraceae bacterium]